MTKILTDSLREEYLQKASEKIQKDAKKIQKFIESNRLDCVLRETSAVDEAEHRYHVARKMWEVDGYNDPPTTFARIGDRENTLLKRILP